MRQRDLKFTFVVGEGKLAFDVVEFELEEALCEPFRLNLKLASDGAWPIAGRLTHGERPPVQRRAQRRISTCSPAPTADRQHAVEPVPNRFHIRRCM